MGPPLRAIEVWWTNDPIRRECAWSSVLATAPGIACPARGFGSHDCRVNRADGFGTPGGRPCEAHLYHSRRPPDVVDFARRLGLFVPGHAPVYRQLASPGERDGVIVDPSTSAMPSPTRGGRSSRTNRPGRSKT